MATLMHSESRRLYSWWWDSHISPKNSKWLQENLKDMDAKVKSMIKLIEEDADSFARRAEMYYKKRPELMKLVEEFYRAYRALAERYDHATGELRQAHRTIVEAFPNHVPYALTDDLPSGSLGSDIEPRTPEMPHPLPAFFDPDELQKDVECLSANSFPSGSEESGFGIGKKGLKQLNEMLGLVGPEQSRTSSGEPTIGTDASYGDRTGQDVVPNGTSHMPSENQNLKARILAESERADKAEIDVQHLKKILEAVETEKVALFHQYDQSLNKLSTLESKLSEVQKTVSLCNERASIVETEIEILNEALIELEAERDAALLQYNQCVERMSDLEHALFQAQDDAIGLHNRALEAEREVESLRKQLSMFASEKETALVQYKQCLAKISELGDKIALSEENSKMLSDQNERAQVEAKELKEAIANLREEKDAIAYLYKQCLETVAKLEYDLSCAQENIKQLNSEILDGAEKLKSIEEQHLLLKTSNQCLQIEANNLMLKIADKDQELSEKQRELDVIQSKLLLEQSQFHQVEATLLSLQKLHSQSKDEQKALTFELENSLQNLKALEACNHDLKQGLERVEAENHSLNEVNMLSATSVKNLQAETISLKELKEGIEKELCEQTYQSNALQQEVDRLNEEMSALNKAYQALLQQVRCAGLNPECIETCVRQFHKENLDLKETCSKHIVEKETLMTKVRDMDNLIEQNANLRCSLSELNGRLEGSKEMVQELQNSCQLLQGEKSVLVIEKASILSQLQSMTESIQNLLEKNTLLETSLSGANAELEGLRVRSRSLEEMCQLLRNEKSNLENERSTLVCLLQNVEQRLCILEERFINFEEKYAKLEKEKESTVTQLEKLEGFYHEDQQLHACYAQSSESRFAGLERHVHDLQEENRLGKKNFEEELDKAVKAQVEIFILQKFMKDLEEKNLSMSIECQNHVEASKLSDKLIKELKNENLEQQIEIEFLLDEIQRLRVGIHQVFWALQFNQENREEEIIKQDQISLPHILDSVEDLRGSLSRDREEKQKLLVENSVLLASHEQLKLDGKVLELEKGALEQELKIVAGEKAMLQEEKQKMLEMNQQLTLEVSAKKQQEELLLADLESCHVQLVYMEDAHLALQGDNSKQLEENSHVYKKLLDLKDKIHVLEEDNSSALHEALALSSLSLVLECFSAEKIDEVKTQAENLGSLQMVNRELIEKLNKLSNELELKEAENIHLKEIVEELHKELNSAKDSNDELNYELVIGKDFLKQKVIELLEFEQRLQSAHNLNAELSGTLNALKREIENSEHIKGNLEMQMHDFSQTNRRQEGEIKRLQEVNGTLTSEISVLQKKMEENKTREENLSLELQERSKEVEIWEAEAASFYFDFQISSINELLLENKVHELTDTCKSLKEESGAKNVQIKEMISRVDHLESEVGRLQSQLSSYVPVVASLENSIASLEKNAHVWTRPVLPFQNKLEEVVPLQKPKMSIDDCGQNSSNSCFMDKCMLMNSEEPKDLSSIGATGVADLQEIQIRLKEVEEGNSVSKVVDSGSTTGPSASYPELELRTSDEENNITNEERQERNELSLNHKLKVLKLELPGQRTAILLKDIPLDQVSGSPCCGSRIRQKGSSDDQMLELWETAEQCCGASLKVDGVVKRPAQAVDSASAGYHFTDAQQKNSDVASGIQAEDEVAVDKLEVPTDTRETVRGAASRNLLERLASDAQKLTSLQTTVLELKKKVERNRRTKRTNDHEYRRVKEQLQEVEQAIVELVNMNDQLTWEIEDSPASIDMNCSCELEEAGSTHRKRVTEQAQKESERIGRLQLEVQSLRHILLKLENERKNRGKTKLSGSRTSALLKGFIHQSGKRSGKKKKACLCGCRRPSTKED